MSRKQLLERIESFKKLEKDWDSYDGLPIPAKNIALAKQLAEHIDEDYHWFVCPCGDGSIQFESNKGMICIRIESYE